MSDAAGMTSAEWRKKHESVECPRCLAPRRMACVTSFGARTTPHFPRIYLALWGTSGPVNKWRRSDKVPVDAYRRFSASVRAVDR